MVSAPLPGARESFAGDDFHVLWAVRRVLALLDPSSRLERVVMEDLTPLPVPGIEENLLLAVDLTEFYGGSTLVDAERIVVSQLKYSQRHPATKWTAARLAAKGSRGQKGVVARLSDLFAGVVSAMGRGDVLKRVEIRLVSNQPCAGALADALAAAQEWLARRPDPVRQADLLAALNSRHRDQIERLSGASSLPSRGFTDFLRVLDLRHTGADGRSEQDLRITQQLAGHVMADLRYASLAVADLVRQRGGPDGIGRPIDVADVLAALDVHSELDLLPSPPRFVSPPRRVPSPDAAAIAAGLAKATDRRVLAHGGAGVGKTTAILGLHEELPEGSVVLTYDCFGDGDYETPGAARHIAERFALQICNELAARCRLPVLVRPSTSIHDLWRELERRVAAAAAMLGEDGARLVIVVDAADNAAWAGRRFDDPTFLTKLWALPIPEGAGLVITCRTGRRDTVGRPVGVREVPLRGFDIAASGAYLRARFPDATDEEASAFHRNSAGNPRMQFYALAEAEADGAGSVKDAIAQADRTPNDLFADLLAAAVRHAPDERSARDRLAELVCLTKPLTTGRLLTVSGMAADRVRAFCASLVPGVVIDDDVIAFRDEDFANFLRSEVGEDEQRSAHSRLADLFLGQPGDAYAAQVVADHLHNAGRDHDLVALALAGPPTAIPDGLARQQTNRRRLSLALRRVAAVTDRSSACRLLVLAAEAARTDHAVATILRSRPDLGMRYSDAEVVMRVLDSAGDRPWRGPIHMRLAAYYARDGDPDRARVEGRAADAWLRRRQEEDKDWNIEPEDVAAYAEAWFHLHGADAAEEQLRRWRPDRFAQNASVVLVRRLAAVVPQDDLGDLIVTRALPASLRARLLATAFEAGATPGVAAVRSVTTALIGEPVDLDDDDRGWAVTFVELAALRGIGKRTLLRLIRALQQPLPSRAPDRYERLGRYRHPLRMAAMRAVVRGLDLTLDDLMPAAATAVTDDYRARQDAASEQRAMTEQVGPYVAVFVSRARVLRSRAPVAALRAEWDAHFQQALDERVRYRREPDHGYGIWLRAFTDAILACDGADEALMTAACDRAENAVGDHAYAAWLGAARRLIRDDRYRSQALRLVERAAQTIEGAEWPASEQANALLEACAVVDAVDPDQAHDLHARAIRAAEGMDDDATGRLELHAALADGATGAADAATLAWRTTRALLYHRHRVSDEERLPWSKTLRAVGRLHPPTALAFVGQLEDDATMFLSTSIPTVAGPLVEDGFLAPSEALALLLLVGEASGCIPQATKFLERLVPGPARSEALAGLSLRVRRDLLPDRRPDAADALVEWARSAGHGEHEGIRVLEAYRRVPKGPPAPPTRLPRRATAESEWDRREREADRVLARSTTAGPDDLLGDLAELAELFGADRIPEYLQRVRDGLVPSRRRAFIAALASIPADHPVAKFHADDVFTVLISAARDWDESPQLRPQLAAALERFFETHVGSLVRYAETADTVIANVIASPVLDDSFALILLAVGGSLDRLRPAALYTTATQLALELSIDERAELLDWSLDGMEVDAASAPEIPEDRADALAGLLWSLLGAPDKATRWRAAHVVRQLVASGDGEVAAALLGACDRQDAGAFGSSRYPFHWLSAKTWTLMALARAAADAPERMSGLAPRLAAIACDPAWPHASQREFARRAALRVAASSAGALAAHPLENLQVANLPRACLRDRSDRFYRTGSGGRDYHSERFHFDTMDTLPYVYGPFGERFGLSVDEVADRAERWIVDRLGMASDRGLDVRLEHLDYSQRDNSHGRSPRGETWHQMLEEHALQLVAGELCDEGVPIRGERGDDPEDPWHAWLSRWVDSDRSRWLVDERAPVPPDDVLLLRDVEGREWASLCDQELRRAMGAADVESLVVSGGTTFSSSFGYGSTYVSSALVDPRTASALRSAFDGADGPYRLALPMEASPHGPLQQDVDDGDFRLVGWLVDESGDDGLEHHDPLRRIEAEVTRPGSLFLDVTQGALRRGGRVVVDPGGHTIAWQVAWSDIARIGTGRDESSGTAGVQLHVRRDTLAEFLRTTGFLLIIRAYATRRNSTTGYGDDEDAHEQEIHKAYIFDPDVGLVG